jgi:formate hydrogenlyase subunit 3/multisubunit Na+/H+ antiporter MnhD subunit
MSKAIGPYRKPAARRPAERLRIVLWVGAFLVTALVGGIARRLAWLVLPAFLGLVFGVLPVAVLGYVDYLRVKEPALSERPELATLARVPVRALGVLSLVLGIAICLWVPYQLSHRRLRIVDAEGLEALALGISMVTFGFWWLRGARGKRPK